MEIHSKVGELCFIHGNLMKTSMQEL